MAFLLLSDQFLVFPRSVHLKFLFHGSPISSFILKFLWLRLFGDAIRSPVVPHVFQFFRFHTSPLILFLFQILTPYKGLIPPYMEYRSDIWRGFTQTSLLNIEQRKTLRVRLTNSLPLANFTLHRNVASSAVFYR